MRSDDIEEALRELLGASTGPPGLVLTLRRHDEYEHLLERIRELEGKNRDLERQLYQMSSYAPQLLQALDELRICRKILQKNFIDCSFIHSLNGSGR